MKVSNGLLLTVYSVYMLAADRKKKKANVWNQIPDLKAVQEHDN